MRKSIPLLLGFLFFALSLAWGQGGQPLIVMESQGKIKYQVPKGVKHSKIVAGMQLSRDGILTMGKGASLQVLNGMEVVTIDAPGKVALKDAVPASTSGGRFGFGGNFLTQVSRTVQSSARPPAALTGRKGAGGDEPPPATTTRKGAGGDEPPPPVTTRKGAGGDEPPPPVTTRKGMGQGQAMLTWNFPVKGKMYVPENIDFSWEGYVKGEGPWKFSIVDASGESKYEAESAAPYISLNTVQARLSKGQTYSWRVSDAKSPDGLQLRAYSFTLVQEHMEKGVLDAVVEEPEYQKAGPVQKMLWEAYAFETAGYLVKANQLYKEALRQEPGNWLAVQLYQSFWNTNW
jgi:hypothetical protein